MHEHKFIHNIVNQVPDNSNVIGVELEVGELAGITAEHLKEHLKEETGWEVNCKVKEGKVVCKCGHIGEARVRERLHDLVICDCPKCAGEVEIVDGKDIKIVKVIYK